MRSSSGNANVFAISPAAEVCRENFVRQDSAEGLWFAVMCRAIWGANAAKELQCILGRSERTCRAWASGDSEPPVSALRAIMRTKHGKAFQAYVMDGCDEVWWRSLVRAERIIAAEDQIDRS